MERTLRVLLFAAVITFGVWLRVTAPPVASRTPDERTYIAYAKKAAAQPSSGARLLVSGYNNEPRGWIYPIPLRIAYYYTIAAISKAMPLDKAGVALSTGASIVQLLLVALVGLRFFGPWAALIATTMLSVCPQDLCIARRVWGDGVSGCLAMFLLWFCAEIITRRKPWAWYAAFWIFSIYFLLLKESGGFYYGFCVLGLAVHAWLRDRSWKGVACIAAGAIVTAVCAFAIMAAMCGGAAAALETVRHSAQAAPTNEYGILYQSGPWYSFPLGLWVLSPLAAIGCAAAFAGLFKRGTPRQPPLVYGMAAIIVLVLIAATLPPALKNLRYISFIFGPWYLMAGIGLARLAGALRRPYVAAPLLAMVVLYSCWWDYARYRDLFVRQEIPDLDIRQIAASPFFKDV